jgi:hypothetical protein
MDASNLTRGPTGYRINQVSIGAFTCFRISYQMT